MNPVGVIRSWLRAFPDRQDSVSWAVSLIVHLCILIALALLWQHLPDVSPLSVGMESFAPERVEAPLEEVQYEETPSDEIGAGIGAGTSDTVTQAPTLDDGIRIETPTSLIENGVDGPAPASLELISATPDFGDRVILKGDTGIREKGSTGAVDQITHAIELSLEQSPTLVVWLMDQSQSLRPQRATIEAKFDRIYEELGIIQARGGSAFAKHDRPLLTSVIAFGKDISLLTKEPTDDLAVIKDAIHNIKNDPLGEEKTFSAVLYAAKQYQRFRNVDPRRNVIMVVVSDEKGDDDDLADKAVDTCRKLRIPVYVIGVPAPFGQQHAYVNYVDPDEKYDQTPQNIPVDQGPESAKPENVQLGFSREDWNKFASIDSGFGPYALTRLCRESGGKYIGVHPNYPTGGGKAKETDVMATRIVQFFNPAVMHNYEPDYLPGREYDRLVNANRARAALVEAARISLIEPMDRPKLAFPRRNDAELKRELDQAQQAAALVEPKIDQLLNVLRSGEKDRAKLEGARWQAGYDLAIGRAMAVKVRTSGYNAMLAKAENGMKFEKPDSDTWLLRPDADITVNSALKKMAVSAREYLERVRKDHPDTPWAYLADRELSEPLGWKWGERHTGFNDPPRMAGGNGNGANPQDKLRKLEKKPVRQDVKL